MPLSDRDPAHRLGASGVVRTHGWFVGASLIGALSNAVVPLAALVLLQPRDYGLFSYVYLVFAWGTSLTLSLICESWLRARRSGRGHTSAENYAQALTHLSTAFGLVALIVSVALHLSILLAIGFSVATALSVYRFGARFRTICMVQWRRTALSDLALVTTFAAVAAGGLAMWNRLDAVAIAWAGSSLAGSLAMGVPTFSGHGGVVSWIREHRNEVRTLVADSTIMDVGANGSAVLIATVLTTAQFGIYRGISNVAMPIRIVFGTLRPAIASRSLVAVVSPAKVAAVFVLSGAVGLIAFGSLEVVLSSGHHSIGTLSLLSSYAVECGAFVAVSGIAQYFYAVCRNHAAHRSIILVQITQTAAMFVLPLLGKFTDGLQGVVIGYVVAAAVGAFGWVVLAWRTARQASTGALQPRGAGHVVN